MSDAIPRRETAEIKDVLFKACKEGRHDDCDREFHDNGIPEQAKVIYYCTCKHHKN